MQSDQAFLKQAQNMRPQLERDKLFAASIQHRPVVLGYMFYGANVPGGDRKVGMLLAAGHPQMPAPSIP